jgi:hypothetical protein
MPPPLPPPDKKGPGEGGTANSGVFLSRKGRISSSLTLTYSSTFSSSRDKDQSERQGGHRSRMRTLRARQTRQERRWGWKRTSKRRCCERGVTISPSPEAAFRDGGDSAGGEGRKVRGDETPLKKHHPGRWSQPNQKKKSLLFMAQLRTSRRDPTCSRRVSA